MQVQLQKEEKQEDIMENRSCIQQSLDKIEAELASEISVNELAKKAGYSLFYYYCYRSWVRICIWVVYDHSHKKCSIYDSDHYDHLWGNICDQLEKGSR